MKSMLQISLGLMLIALGAGQSAQVQIEIDPSSPSHPLSYYDTSSHQWRIAAGTYQVYVGTSERDTVECSEARSAQQA